ncbi:MAG TPA: T9SS type A sorting domain-containing protein [Ohtaekwangia sp.]
MKLRLRWFAVLFAGVVAILISQELFAQSYPVEAERTTASLIKSVQLFPNPAVDYVHIRIEQVDISKVRFSLHNLIGNKQEVEYEVMDEHELRIKVKDLAMGYYLITVNDMETNLNGTFKFVKK